MAAVPFIVDIKRLAPTAPFPLGRPVAEVRGGTSGQVPSLTPGNNDTIKWVNQLPNGEDVIITYPPAKRVFKNMDPSFDVPNNSESTEFVVKNNVPPQYSKILGAGIKAKKRYFVLCVQSGDYAEANSDPEIEIK